jgi:hypothetical protein
MVWYKYEKELIMDKWLQLTRLGLSLFQTNETLWVLVVFHL